jgi:flagellar hook-basal body complex protein FliE
MAIAPINKGELVGALSQKQITAGSEQQINFKDLLNDAINNVVKTDAEAQINAINIAAGETDDLHTLAIGIAKADLALQTLIQVRNKVIEAYNEIMRISL